MSAWATLPLGQVVTFQRGYDLPLRARKSGDIPIVSSAGVTDFHDVAMVDPPGVVTGRYGTIGEIFLISEPFWPLNTTLYVRDFHGNDPRFIYHLLQRFDFASFSGKSGVPGVNRNDLHVETVTLPTDLPEQCVIAAALNDVDTLLDGLDRLIAKKRDLNQAAKQQLLTGRTRLPGFDGEWEVKRLGDIVSFSKGSGLSKADLALDGKRRCVHYGELFTTYGECITEVLHGTDREDLFFYSLSNDVLMPTSDVTPSGLATASCIRVSDVILGGDILVIRTPDGILNGEFLAHSIRANRNQVLQLVSGTTVFHLYGRDMAGFCFAAPSAREQTAIVGVLSDMDAEIAALEACRYKMRNIKQAMMQELLTGKTRLVQSVVTDD